MSRKLRGVEVMGVAVDVGLDDVGVLSDGGGGPIADMKGMEVEPFSRWLVEEEGVWERVEMLLEGVPTTDLLRPMGGVNAEDVGVRDPLFGSSSSSIRCFSFLNIFVFPFHVDIVCLFFYKGKLI